MTLCKPPPPKPETSRLCSPTHVDISVQKTVPELDNLLNCYVDAPSSSALTPGADNSAVSPRATGGRLGGSYSHSQQRKSTRRSPAAAAVPFGSPQAGLGNVSAVGLGAGSGGSLLDVSGISGIAGSNDYNYNDSSGLFRDGGGGGGGVNNSGRYNLEDKDDYRRSNTGSNKRISNLGGEQSPGWQRPISGRMAATPTAISPHVDALLASRTASLGLGGGRAKGQAVRTPARSRSSMTDSFLLMHGGSSGGEGGDSGSGGVGGGGGENGRAVSGVGRNGTVVMRGGGGGGGSDMRVSREWDARGDESEGEGITEHADYGNVGAVHAHYDVCTVVLKRNYRKMVV